MLWLITAALGDAATAILACAGLLLGVWIMARGPRRGGAEAPVPASASAQAEPAAPVAAAPVPSAVEGTPATTFRQGTIRLAGEPEPEVAPEPAPEVAPEPAPEPEPAPPALPQVPPTGFRQGRIRVGGIERGKPRDE